jgi:hypothetical protein
MPAACPAQSLTSESYARVDSSWRRTSCYGRLNLRHVFTLLAPEDLTMHRRNPAAGTLLWIVTFACTTDSTISTSTGDLAVWQLSSEPLLHIGVVEGDSNYQFFRASSATRLPDEAIVVSNAGTGQLRYFSPDGTFLHHTGGRGGGPGEFRELISVYSAGRDSVMAYDQTGRKSYFDAAGNFVGSENVMPSGETEFPMDPWLYRRNWVEGLLPGEMRRRVARALDRMPPPVGASGYRFVRVDREGNIWVGDDIEPEGERSHWTVHDSTGTPIARVSLPPRFEIFEVTGHDILGWRDSADVEFIRVYALEKVDRPAARRSATPSAALAEGVTSTGTDTLILKDVRSILSNAVIAQERYFAGHGTYASNRHDLEWDLPDGVLFDLISAGGTGWLGVVVHRDASVICGIGIGSYTPPAWLEGAPKCAETTVP